MYKIYQVEYGDTLDIIADKASTTVNELKRINGFNNDSDLVVGSLIIVPRSEDNLFETYIVKQGDTIYSISKMYNVDSNTLLSLNGLNSNDYIYPNQEILIPNDEIVVYITKNGDTLDNLTEFFNTDLNTLSNENNKIFVLEDQLIIHKK